MFAAAVQLATQGDRDRRPETAAQDDAQHQQAGYVVWTYIGPESVFFYPPGSAEEHLVTEHGIPSVNLHLEGTGHHAHRRDHLKQTGARTGAVGDLVAMAHPHSEAA